MLVPARENGCENDPGEPRTYAVYLLGRPRDGSQAQSSLAFVRAGPGRRPARPDPVGRAVSVWSHHSLLAPLRGEARPLSVEAPPQPSRLSALTSQAMPGSPASREAR